MNRLEINKREKNETPGHQDVVMRGGELARRRCADSSWHHPSDSHIRTCPPGECEGGQEVTLSVSGSVFSLCGKLNWPDNEEGHLNL